jgi:hypothetical protein
MVGQSMLLPERGPTISSVHFQTELKQFAKISMVLPSHDHTVGYKVSESSAHFLIILTEEPP